MGSTLRFRWAGATRLLLTCALAAAGCSPTLSVPDAGLPCPGCGPPRYLFRSDKVDLLFMVDNSSGTEALQAELIARIGRLFAPLLDSGSVDLNIGVVTSDYGAGATGAPGCSPSGPSGGGDRGRLQALGRGAPAGCQPPVGTAFIHYVHGPAGPGRDNLPATQDLAKTFACMAAVGSQGCGFEHPLESVYAALHNNLAENQGNPLDPGFLRDDALLVVVFVTSEDDASAPPDSDVFGRDKTALYGYEDSYSRQTRFAVQCGAPPAFPPYAGSNGPLLDCAPAPNQPTGAGPGKQFDVRRYIDFFTTPLISGGVKVDPLEVVLVGIDAPEAPFEVILSDPARGQSPPYPPCAKLDEGSSPPCVPVLQHSCIGADPRFFGDPAVRLNAVIGSALRHQIASICDGDFGPTFDQLATTIRASIGPRPLCLDGSLPRDPLTGALVLDCAVWDETLHGDGTKAYESVPACDARHSVLPCWVIAPSPLCAQPPSPDGLLLTIDRGVGEGGAPLPAPPHTTTLASCLAP